MSIARMARILILSSWVAFGHVGLCAAAPALQALGHSVTQLPTVFLSNHPGWPNVSGRPVPPDEIRGMVNALETNGWLDTHDALLIGYLPSPDHVVLACDLVDRMRRGPGPLRIVVDPVLGDLPDGLYLAEPVAAAVRDRLVALADVLTPNLFELGWLTGRPVRTLPEAEQAANALRATSGAKQIFVTSPPIGDRMTGLLCIEGSGARAIPSPLRCGVPHGVGDVFSAFIAAGLAPDVALDHLTALIDASRNAPHLRIAETASAWTRTAPFPTSEN